MYTYLENTLSVSVTSLAYGILPVVTNVSVLSDLWISGCELKDNHYISFILLFKTNFYLYIGILVIFKPQHGFSIAGAGYTFYPVWKGYFES